MTEATNKKVLQLDHSSIVLVLVLVLVCLAWSYSYREGVFKAVIPAVQSGLARLSHGGIASGDIELRFHYYCCYTCLNTVSIYLTSSTCLCNIICISPRVCSINCFCIYIKSKAISNIFTSKAKATVLFPCQVNRTSSGSLSLVESKYKYSCAKEVCWSCFASIGRYSDQVYHYSAWEAKDLIDLRSFHRSMFWM